MSLLFEKLIVFSVLFVFASSLTIMENNIDFTPQLARKFISKPNEPRGDINYG
jgi:hypothetical protein